MLCLQGNNANPNFEHNNGIDCCDTEPQKTSELDLSLKRLESLLAEQESWIRRTEQQSDENRNELQEKIERAHARVYILSRIIPTKLPNTSHRVGHCMVCHEKTKGFKLVGCSHCSELCSECYNKIVETSSIGGYDAIPCPVCRDPITGSDKELEEVNKFVVEHKRRREILERERLQNQALVVDYIRRYEMFENGRYEESPQVIDRLIVESIRTVPEYQLHYQEFIDGMNRIEDEYQRKISRIKIGIIFIIITYIIIMVLLICKIL